MTDGISVRRDGRVIWLTLDRPDSGNSVTRAMQRTLTEQLREASRSPEVGAVVLTAAGQRHFCTGPDLRDPEMAPDPQRAAGDAARILREGSQAVVCAILDCEKPVICALNGTAAGVGASLVLACDLVIASSSSRLIELFARRGLAPDGGAAYLLARRLPLNIAKELVFFAEDLPAQRAQELGLVNRVVEPDVLVATAAEWATRLATGPTRAHAAAKAMLNQAPDVDRAAALGLEAVLVEQVASTDDVAEGVAAFLEQRKATFRGR